MGSRILRYLKPDRKYSYRAALFLLLVSANFFCHRDLNDLDGIVTPIITPISVLSVGSAKDGIVELYWQSSTYYSPKYFIYMSKSNPDQFTKIAEISNNYYLVKGLSYDTTYRFTVSVYFNEIESELSNIVTARPVNFSPPSAPSNVMVQGINYEGKKNFYISWGKNTESDISHYKILRKDPVMGSTTVIAETFDNYFNDTIYNQLNANVSYAVSAIDRGGLVSFLSNFDSDLILDTVSLLLPVQNSTVYDKVVFRWKQVDNAVGYRIVLLASQYGTELWQKTVAPSASGYSEVTYDGDPLMYRRNYYWKVCTFSKTSSILNSYSFTKSFYFTYSE